MNMRRGAWAAQRPLTTVGLRPPSVRGEQLPPALPAPGGPLAASQGVN